MTLKDAETGGKSAGKTSKGVLTELEGASGHNVRSQLPPALLKADATSIAITAEKDGKLRARTNSWTEPVVVQKGDQLTIRNVDGQVHVYRMQEAA